MTKLIFKEEYYLIVNSAIKVWKNLGYGFLEKIYENALYVEIIESNFQVEQQKAIKVYYKNKMVGDYCADLLVNNKIILEIKTCKVIAKEYIAQVLNYLKATGIALGIILNFGPEKLEHKRLVF